MSILITGGCGFIGSHIADKLIEKGYDVEIIGLKCRLENIENVDKVKFTRVDIQDREAVLNSVNKDTESILHLAALINVDESIQTPEPFWNVNVLGTFNILEAARPDEIKDPQLLHDIIVESKDTMFILAGISESEPLKSMKADNVIKLGLIPNDEVKKYYSAADVFILTSKSEGFPGVLLEAMSSGLPLITTKIGGTIDIVNKNVGVFIDRNGKKASRVITSLKNNKKLLKKLSKNCVKNAKEKYDWSKITEQYEKIYNS